MPNLNRVLLMGNLTRDPDVRYLPKGTAVAEIGMAINRQWTAENGEKKEEVTFVDVTLWGRQAEIAGQYLGKGKPVMIEGRLQLESWDDKTSGQKRTKLKVVCENLQLLGSKPADGPTQPTEPTPSPALAAQRAKTAGTAQTAAASRPAHGRDPDLDAEPDDIPF